MIYKIISTGSKGNAVIINDTLLIDCGVSFRALKEDYKKLKLVLLTHIHSDHFKPKTIGVLARERPNLRFACPEYLYKHLINAGVKSNKIDVLKIGCKADYRAFGVVPIKLYHNVENVGYRVYWHGEKLLYATDTNSLEGVIAKDYDLYMLEANYTEEDILKRINDKKEKGLYCYEFEVIKNHLSKEKCDNFIMENIGNKGRFVYLHGHEERVRKSDNSGCNQRV